MRRSSDRSAPSSEQRFIESLRRAFAGTASDAVTLAIGDDAAVLSTRGTLVWSIDDSVEGVHFRRDWVSLGSAAERAFHAAVSDIAAMGAEPVAALSSLQLRPSASATELAEVRRAQARVSRTLACPIVGGNVTRGEAFRFTTTVLGRVSRPVLRSAAQPGHSVWLLGAVGLAGCGRAWLDHGLPGLSPRSALGRAIRACVAAWRKPRARIAEGLMLRGRYHSAIDVSDGLGRDASTLSDASGVQIVLDEQLLRKAISPDLVLAAAPLDRDPLEFALAGGEDYALLVTGPVQRRPRGAVVIGEVRRGSGAFLQGGSAKVPVGRGYDHLGPSGH